MPAHLTRRALAVAFAVLGCVLWINYPVFKPLLGVFLLVYGALLYRWPLLWLAVLPACVPLLQLAHWSGRLFLEDLDIVFAFTLAALLWPEVPDRNAQASLRTALYELRRAFGQDAGALLFVERTRVGLCADAAVIDGGVVVAAGPREEILTDRALLEAHGLELPWAVRTARESDGAADARGPPGIFIYEPDSAQELFCNAAVLLIPGFAPIIAKKNGPVIAAYPEMRGVKVGNALHIRRRGKMKLGHFDLRAIELVAAPACQGQHQANNYPLRGSCCHTPYLLSTVFCFNTFFPAAPAS